jgi:hypothetical protein
MLAVWDVKPCVDTTISEEHTASIFKAEVLKMEVVCLSKSTRRYNPEGQHGHLYRREKLKSQ